MAMGLLALGEAFQPPAVYKKDVQPSIVVVVVEGQTTTRRLEKVLVFIDAAVDGFDFQSRAPYDIHETDTQRCALNGRFRTRGRRSGFGIIASFDRASLLFRRSILLLRHSEGQHIHERKHQSRATERTKKFASIGMQGRSSSVVTAVHRRRWHCRRRASDPCACAKARSP